MNDSTPIRKPPPLFLVAALLSAPLAAEIPPAPNATIERATSAIQIDGVLDEAAWADAAKFELAWEWSPGNMTEPPVKTDCLFAYDDRHLYIAFKAYDPEPSKIRAHLMDRDEIETFVQDDHISVMVDTFNDRRRAFQFRVNPLGVQADAIFSEIDGIEDWSWDMIWDSAGKITDQGYVVEIALPFNQLRFPGGGSVQTWGFEAGRSYPRDVRHRIAANPRDRNDNCLMCQFNKVTGFEGLEPGLNLEIVPTLTAIRTDTNPTFPMGGLVAGDEDFDLGLGVNWGATPNTTLSATINPDFSQVEADVAQLDTNQRFALFFPEKRPFFLEGVDFFSTQIRAVYTRTVADPDWGAKVTSKSGKNTYGMFVARDSQNNLLIPSNQGSGFVSLDEEVLSGVMRYRRDVGESSTVGFLYTGRDGADSGYRNHVSGVDGRWRINKLHDLSFQYLYSDTRNPGQSTGSFGGGAWVLDWNRVSEKLILSLERHDYATGFRADSGFVARTDYTRSLGVIRRNWRPENKWYTQWQAMLFAERYEDQAGDLLEQRLFAQTTLHARLQSITQVSVEQSDIVFGGFRFDDVRSAEVWFQFQPLAKLRFTMFALAGDSIDFENMPPAPAEILFLEPAVEFKIGRRFNARVNHTTHELDVAGGELFAANLTQGRFVYQFNTRMFVRTILQYRDVVRDPSLYNDPVDAESENLLTQFLFSYKINPQTVAFVGYSDTRIGTDMFDRMQADRTFFIKLGYAWVK